MLFSEMLTEVPNVTPWNQDHSLDWSIKTVDQLLMVFDQILTTAPGWDSSLQIGTPINAALVWPMATTAGFAVFLKENVNQKLQAILQYWGNYLMSSDSCVTLNNGAGGWFSVEALNSKHMHDFVENYVCDPTKPYYGFTSWDNFFTRQFRTGKRPVSDPEDPAVLVSAAECTAFSCQSDVKLKNDFWVKGQPYSLTHMLNGDPRASDFVGGSVFQAFLSADSYHCWHAPVAGTITDFELVPGTYYSEPVLFSFKPDDGCPTPDPGADANSQGYISAVAARGLIWIKADNPDIGTMCIVMIGMAEVSSIDLTMPIGQHFEKGDQIGRFHFGGSTHCLVFGPDVKIEWAFDPDNLPEEQIPVSSKIGVISKKTSKEISM